MFRKISGFSLIETAIVLIIIGIIGGMTFPIIKVMVDWQKTSTTAQNQEKILYALASYVTHWNALPYPADPRQSQGKQDVLPRRRGIIPYADLGLPEATAKDGYNRWFTYVIDDHYGTQSTKHSLTGNTKPKSKLCEGSLDKNPLHAKLLTVKFKNDMSPKVTIAVAVISHGPEGRGAYPHAVNSPPLGEDEELNTHSDTTICDRPYNQDSSNPFSHKVVWVTAKNLLAIYGRSPCPPIDPTPHQNQYLPENPKK